MTTIYIQSQGIRIGVRDDGLFELVDFRYGVAYVLRPTHTPDPPPFIIEKERYISGSELDNMRFGSSFVPAK